jgi:hypothetical protein
MTSSQMPFMWLFIFLFTFGLTTSSCDPSASCSNANCRNGADCEKGQCFCTTGYEGVQCQTQWIEKFLGNFTSVNAANCNRVFSSDIIQTDRIKLKISNLGGFVDNICTEYVTATLTSSTTFKVDETFCSNFHITAEGNFNESTKKLTVNYTCIKETSTYSCTAVYQY